MEKGFWEDKWQRNEIGFHLDRVHPLLSRFLPAMEWAPGSHLLVPLCGKTLDIGYLLESGFTVTGVELSAKAVVALFQQLGLDPGVSDWAGGRLYQQGALRVFQGDIFTLDGPTLGKVDGIYDRAALIALPDELRQQYARHLLALTDAAPQLLITLDYCQAQMPGPPFSVDADTVRALYADRYRIGDLSRRDILEYEPRFRERGLTALYETARKLEPALIPA
ncbi:thiopurine S-methyltransferase [Alcanivorax hongdengensis A-11-3]|uniref:Thiopurine S-methyltransferase n=1 Tax=Alcanivorax hongdengensis A-11-3 TaxID=1177179 RepID=L0WC76_9GAMM|nr:thiopurine S-methyltransferase [Alcanivorax hongdengensis]EKF74594.1 thiopurine S-methyltransferase [Alcanivorax hongdengensis A-11-3]